MSDNHPMKEVRATLKHQESFKWWPEATVLHPENTEDRTEEGFDKEIRVGHNFAFWYKGKSLIPVSIDPGVKHDWENIVLRAEVASINGPSGFLMQAGIFDVEWPVTEIKTMQLDNIQRISAEKNDKFQGGKRSFCVHTEKYMYFLLEPEDCYMPWWNASVPDWERHLKVKKGSMQFVPLKQGDPRPEWFKGRLSWAKFSGVDVDAIPRRTDDVFDGPCDAEEAGLDPIQAEGPGQGSASTGASAAKATKGKKGKGKGRVAKGQMGKGETNTVSVPRKRKRASSSTLLEQPESLAPSAGIRKPRLGPTPDHTPGPLDVYRNNTEKANTGEEASKNDASTSMNEAGPANPSSSGAPPAAAEIAIGQQTLQVSEEQLPPPIEPVGAQPSVPSEAATTGFAMFPSSSSPFLPHPQSQPSASVTSQMHQLQISHEVFDAVVDSMLNGPIGEDEEGPWRETFDSSQETHEMSQHFGDFGPQPPFTQDTYAAQSSQSILNMMEDPIMPQQDTGLDYMAPISLQPPAPSEDLD